jgi:truncated hemoglobin YjbI
MEEILKKLVESEVLNEETKEEVTKAFRKSLDEAKLEQEKSLRTEFAERYERDKKAIHTALEKFLEQELSEHVNEFREGIDEVNRLKKQYADKMVLVREQAQKFVSQRLGAVEKVIDGVLRKELTELHESEKVNRRAYVNAITEAKAKADADYNVFRKKGAAVLENIVNVQIQGTLDELREDIKAARQSDFGREIYESFMTTFRRQFFDSSKEFKKVVGELRQIKKELQESKKAYEKKIVEAQNRAKAAEVSSRKLQESVVRARTINKMLEGLTGKSREKMRHLLEATKTNDLQKTYKKFLPEIINESKVSTKPRTKKVDEAVIELKTGGQRNLTEEKVDDDDEILEIQQLAGVSGKR